MAAAGSKMRNPYVLGLFVLVFFLISAPERAEASHALGAELTYECLGGDQYLVRLVFYRDCGGIAAPTAPTVVISSSCGNMNLGMTLQPPEPQFPPFDQYLAPYELPVYCSASNCGSGSNPGLQEYVYEATVTLPPCANWTMSYDLCCRSAAINTINAPGSQDIYVNAFLNNVAAPCNSSPQFDVPARGFLCLNEDNTILATATDPDGDLLVYSLYTPWHNPGASVNYNGGYNPNNPLNNSYYNFNNGVIDVFPTTNGQITVIGVMVEEYRNGVLIGRVVRDMQVRVINNCPQNPGNDFDIDQDGIFDADTIVLCADNPLQLDVYLNNTDPTNNYFINVENLADFGGATFNSTPDPNNPGAVIGHFIWTPPSSSIGTSQVLIFSANDDNCPVVGYANFTFEFVIAGLELDVEIDTVAISCTDSVQMVTNVSNGFPPYTYLWNDGSTDPNRWVTAGEYIIVVTDSEGCTGDDTITVYYIDDPVALFDPSNGCVDSTIVFVDQSFSNYPTGYPPVVIVDWAWEFGDGVTATGVASPNHTYDSAGSYDVQLVATNDLGCVDTIEHTIWANPPPNVDFTFQNVCQDTAFVFTDQSTIDTGQVASWAWDFGDGTAPFVGQNAAHQYATDEFFDVTLVAMSDSSCPASLTQPVYVFPLPVAHFSPTDVCHGNVSAFTDLSTVDAGSLEFWQWDFGDGGLSDMQNPVHTYGDTGVFDVTLISHTDSMCGDTVTLQVTVHPTPVADYVNDTVCAELVMTFADQSTISTGSIANWSWYFGDGNTSAIQDPTNIYTLGGQYTGSLVVESDLGCVDTMSQNIIVYPKPLAEFNTLAACLNDPNQFVDESLVATGSDVTGWNWNFGDNAGSSTAQFTQYTYSGSGVFDVTLIAETDFGCLDTTVHTTEVYDLPVSDFTFDDVCLYDAAIYQNTSSIPTGSITQYDWDFGDGDGSSDQQPVGQSYLTAGLYDVQLATTSNHGCVDTLVQTIEIFPLPYVFFNYDSVCYPFETQFTDLSSVSGAYNVTDWQWKYGDGITENGIQHPSYAYDSWGDYFVELSVTTDAGCNGDTTLGPVRVYPKPEADFSDEIANCFEEITEFEDQSTLDNFPTDSLVSWNWDFADGQSSNDVNPSNLFPAAAFYDVELIVTTNNGCLDTAVQAVEIYPLPDVKFTVDTNFGCQPFQAWFTDLTTITEPYILSDWLWNFGDGGPSVTTRHPENVYMNDTLGDFQIGVYSVSLQVTSANGCVSDTVYENYMTEYPKPDALFAVDPERTDIIFPKFQITDLSSPNVYYWLYEWGDGAISQVQNPSYEYADTGYYQIIQYVTTEFGCMDTAQTIVRVDPEFRFYIPSAFTPNSNGDNEEFFGQGIGIREYTMNIFNRWGDLIFTSNEYDYHWDGTVNGHQVQEGVYIYSFDILDVKGEPHIYRGHVTVFR